MAKKDKPNLDKIYEVLANKGIRNFIIGSVNQQIKTVTNPETGEEKQYKGMMVVTIENDRNREEKAKYRRMYLLDKDYKFIKEIR